MQQKRKLRVGIIGAGGIAKSHVRAYRVYDDVEIVGVCDIIDGKAAAFCKEFNLDTATAYDGGHAAMLDDETLHLDAVSVCTYNCQHVAPSIYAMKKGIHVLLEKPMCVTMDEAAELLRAEKETGVILSIGFQPRLDPNMQMIKKIVQSGQLGKIYYIQTGGGRRRGIPISRGTSFIEQETAGIGALADIGCYALDMVLNAIGNPKPLSVSGYTSAFFGTDPKYSGYVQAGHPEYAKKFGVDDFAAAFIRLENDVVVDFRISWAMNMDTSGDTLILGTKGGLRIPSTECWNGSVGGSMTIYHEVCGEQVETTVPILEVAKEGRFALKIRSFLDAIIEGKPAPVPTSEILYNQAILCGIHDSAKLGREVQISIPEI